MESCNYEKDKAHYCNLKTNDERNAFYYKKSRLCHPDRHPNDENQQAYAEYMKNWTQIKSACASDPYGSYEQIIELIESLADLEEKEKLFKYSSVPHARTCSIRPIER